MALGLDMTNPKEWELFQRFIVRLASADLKHPRKANMQAFKLAMADVFGANRPDNFQEMATHVIQAVQVIPRLPWPYIPVLEDYDQKYYTGLQLTTDPGMNVVWVGSALLVMGLCIMLYISHRKLWVIIRPEKEGLKITLAGMSNRNPLNFKREFKEISNNFEDKIQLIKQGENV
jgi:cytochrome c biogenesis protein